MRAIDDIPMSRPFDATGAGPNAVQPAAVATARPDRDQTIERPNHVPHGERNASGGAVHRIGPALLLPSRAVAWLLILRIFNRKIRMNLGR